jgi:hypothetical protein
VSEALERDFHHVEPALEQAMSKFKKDRDHEVRKGPLVEMRRLLREADSLNEAPEGCPAITLAESVFVGFDGSGVV